MTTRLAIVVSHPIQHFAPWHREVARLSQIELRVFFCCDWGVGDYFDRDFKSTFKWDIPLLEGYEHEFLPIRRRPTTLNYRQVDNPEVQSSLDRFAPDVVKVFGYTYRTNWRVAQWTKRKQKPLLLYSDSNGRAQTPGWKRIAKQTIVSRFYSKVDGALFVGDNNFAYHRRFGLPQERLFAGTLPVDGEKLLNSVPDPARTRREIREKHGIPQDAFVVILCGKYTANKRPIDLVAAAFALRQRGLPLWALLVGEGPFRPEIEKFCRRENISNATLTGFVNQSLIPRYYASADALAVTSQIDNHPLVISEAAVFSLPVVVSDQVGCIGPRDTARPGVNATTYPCGDRLRLAEAIAELWEDKRLYHKMSLAAAKIAKTQDIRIAAKHLEAAAQQLHRLGPR
jgi:glycosyltransferase involved in cell wall biosynthesis